MTRTLITTRIGLLLFLLGYSHNSYNPIIDLPFDSKKGARVYGRYCAHCHGNNKEGGMGPSLLNLHNIDFVIDKIKNGGGNMPRFLLKDNEMADLISYLMK